MTHFARNVRFPLLAAGTVTASYLWDQYQFGTRCEAPREVPTTSDDNYPDFARYPKKSIAQYLTKSVYDHLKDQTTANGVTLECILRGAVALPYGANPPRGVAGVFAGDAESYHVFAELLDPIIQDYHHVPDDIRRKPSSMGRSLRRHRTNLSVQLLVKDQIDPKGEYILYTRIRLARSIKGFPFGPAISRAQRRQIQKLIADCTSDFQEGKFRSIMELSNEVHDDLIQRRLLFRDPDAFALSAGTHRDWPDGRGVYYDKDPEQETPKLIIWCNDEDHIWIISNAKGGNVQQVFTKLSEGAQAMEASLQKRGHSFEEDPRLGFLNTSPTNIGTGLRATVYVKLPLLGKQPGFDELVRQLRLEKRSDYSGQDKRYTGIFDMSNMESLGKTEVELTNIMIAGVAKLIELEKRLEKGETVDLRKIRAWEL